MRLIVSGRDGNGCRLISSDPQLLTVSRANFAVVPGPFINPSIGVGLNVMPVLMFHPDKEDAVSPPSMAVMTILYAAKPPLDGASSRQSLFLNAATRLYFDEDRWRVVVMAAYFNLYQQFFGLGGDVSSDALFDYRLEQVIAVTQVFRQVGWKGFYVGAMAGYITLHTKTDDPANQEVLDSLGSGAAWRGQPFIGVLSQYDTRDNKYYPSSGVNMNVRVNGSFQSGQEYLVIAPSFNQYLPLGAQGDRLILAYRIYGQFGTASSPSARTRTTACAARRSATKAASSSTRRWRARRARCGGRRGGGSASRAAPGSARCLRSSLISALSPGSPACGAAARTRSWSSRTCERARRSVSGSLASCSTSPWGRPSRRPGTSRPLRAHSCRAAFPRRRSWNRTASPRGRRSRWR